MGKSAEERLTELDKLLDDYETSLGLPAIRAVGSDDIGRLLTMDYKTISKLSKEETENAASTLSAYAIHLQRAINREQARVRLAEESIKRIIAPTVYEAKGYSYDERRASAVREDDVAAKWDAIRVNAALRVERLAFLASQVGNYAKTFMRYHGKSSY